MKARQVSKCKNCKIYILHKNKKSEVYIKRAQKEKMGGGKGEENYTVGIGIWRRRKDLLFFIFYGVSQFTKSKVAGRSGEIIKIMRKYKIL